MEALKWVRNEMVRPRRIIEAGLVVTSFAVPALIILGGYQGELQLSTREALILIAGIGGWCSMIGVTITEFVALGMEANTIVRRLEAKFGAGQSEHQAEVMDAGVPVVGATEVEE